MRLDLMSLPGEGLCRVIDSCRDRLSAAGAPCVGYLPAANPDPGFYLDETRGFFAGMAEVQLIDPVGMDRASLSQALDRVSLLYVPGGNTYLLAYRLRAAGIFDDMRQRLADGLQYVGFSAGAVLCGLDILNSGDANAPGLAEFAGLELVPVSFDVHYPADESRLEHDGRIREYHAFNRTPALALEDDARVRVDDAGMRPIDGHSWLIDASGTRVPLRSES